jgi:antitoxin component YwqK of YwqJK toxin-antitoxin module
MRFISVFIGLFFCGSAMGQYYYNDILATQQSQLQYQLLRTNKVKKISAISYEDDRTPTEGFKLTQEISNDGKKLVTSTSNISGKTSETTSFFEQGKLKSTESYSNGIENKMEYSYDANGTIKLFTLTTADTAMNYHSVETREWHSNASGHYTDVIKVKNNTDSSMGSFVYDEADNLVEEHWKKKNKEVETYYYYYNNAHQLTDIVRYNTRLKKLIPDYQYEYDEKGRPIQMTQLAANGKYFVWKYGYNEKGLKNSEKCIDNKKIVVGSIEYKYDY